MAYDLVFGRTRRDFSLGAVPVFSPKTTTDALLSERAKAKAPEPPPEKSLEEVIKDRAREASPEGMRLYDKYRPTYRDHQVLLRMKTDLL